jgi:Uncharacterised protein family UPF0102
MAPRGIQPGATDSGRSSSTGIAVTGQPVHIRHSPVARASSAAASSVPEVVRMHAKDALGRQGEQLAAEYLQNVGFRILDRNYRCEELRVDIVGVLRSPSGDFTIEHLRGVG